MEIVKKVSPKLLVTVGSFSKIITDNAKPGIKAFHYKTYHKVYERLIEECCLELDIPFLATFQEMRRKPSYESLIMCDGIHLNSKGHKWLFEKISNWPSLQKWAQS